MDLTVTIRESDVAMLNELAATQWRNVEQQASALLEQALRAQKARTEPGVIKPRRGRPAAA